MGLLIFHKVGNLSWCIVVKLELIQIPREIMEKSRKNRNFRIISDATYQYPVSSKSNACVKVVYTFACDTSITVEAGM
jgi:hypothetical protein